MVNVDGIGVKFNVVNIEKTGEIKCTEFKNCTCKYKNGLYCCSGKYLKCMEYQIQNNKKFIKSLKSELKNKGDVQE